MAITVCVYYYISFYFITSYFSKSPGFYGVFWCRGWGGESSRSTNRNENIKNPTEWIHCRKYQIQLMLSRLAKWSQSWCIYDDGDYEAVMPFIACVCGETLTDNLEVIHEAGGEFWARHWAAWKTPSIHSFACFTALVFIHQLRTQLWSSLGAWQCLNNQLLECNVAICVISSKWKHPEYY